ncbi:unnamed protein product [Cyprideis torosa]|uniref:Uncharacterized protein n=1 Tax=Cyprideis torosa TaxID=163714 RepID=A0A7R8WAU7_9CRUS|nr:unnamed protein product [Cyprideis torosa]CAG0886228.1 unnamed protein product [Cyprideis torosa]
MFSRFRSAFINVVAPGDSNGALYSESVNGGGADSGEVPRLPVKYPYTRPGYLQLNSEDEMQVAGDQKIRPIIVPRDCSKLPWNSGYAEAVNAGKSQKNEDQSVIHVGSLKRGPKPPSQISLELPYVYFGTFDGHAGVGAAVVAANQLHHIIHSKLVDIIDHLLPPLPSLDPPPPPSRRSVVWNVDMGTDIPIDSLITGALESAFWEMDESISRDRRKFKITGGCTALVALFICGKLYIANAGDSRAVIVRNGNPIPMSFDFTPENERMRIQKLARLKPELLASEYTHLDYKRRPIGRDIGKRILYRDAHMTGWAYKTATTEDLKFPVVFGEGKRSRVLATIGVTRGFGDHDLRAPTSITSTSTIYIKPFLTAQPQVTICDLKSEFVSENDVLIMGTDGLWDITSNEKAAEIVNKNLEHFKSGLPRNNKYKFVSAAQDLVSHSRGKAAPMNSWKLSTGKPATIDDISVFVIPLKPYKSEHEEWSQRYSSLRKLHDDSLKQLHPLSSVLPPVGEERSAPEGMENGDEVPPAPPPSVQPSLGYDGSLELPTLAPSRFEQHNGGVHDDVLTGSLSPDILVSAATPVSQAPESTSHSLASGDANETSTPPDVLSVSSSVDLIPAASSSVSTSSSSNNTGFPALMDLLLGSRMGQRATKREDSTESTRENPDLIQNSPTAAGIPEFLAVDTNLAVRSSSQGSPASDNSTSSSSEVFEDAVLIPASEEISGLPAVAPDLLVRPPDVVVGVDQAEEETLSSVESGEEACPPPELVQSSPAFPELGGPEDTDVQENDIVEVVEHAQSRLDVMHSSSRRPPELVQSSPAFPELGGPEIIEDANNGLREEENIEFFENAQSPPEIVQSSPAFPELGGPGDEEDSFVSGRKPELVESSATGLPELLEVNLDSGQVPGFFESVQGSQNSATLTENTSNAPRSQLPEPLTVEETVEPEHPGVVGRTPVEGEGSLPKTLDFLAVGVKQLVKQTVEQLGELLPDVSNVERVVPELIASASGTSENIEQREDVNIKMGKEIVIDPPPSTSGLPELVESSPEFPELGGLEQFEEFRLPPSGDRDFAEVDQANLSGQVGAEGCSDLSSERKTERESAGTASSATQQEDETAETRERDNLVPRIAPPEDVAVEEEIERLDNPVLRGDLPPDYELHEDDRRDFLDDPKDLRKR